MSPYSPKDRYDDLHEFMRNVCKDVGTRIDAEIECIRADDPAVPGVIHHDIWSYVQQADVLVADVSEQNGNVMFELGVSGAWRAKDQVIVIQEQVDPPRFLFDIAATRLEEALLHAMTPAPYLPITFQEPQLPLDLNVPAGPDPSALVSPGVLHRRMLPDGLEFGSFYVFRNSWLTIGRAEHRGVHVKLEMRFNARVPDADPGSGWIGISLRSRHFFANYGHLVYVRPDGRVMHTVPIDESNKEPQDPEVGTLPGFGVEPSPWVEFDLYFDDASLRGSIGGISLDLPVPQMPHVYNAGLLRIQTYRARACVRRVFVEAL
jgi:hypothetical protein